MAHPFDIEVVAADHKVYGGKAVSVVLPGADGYFGVLDEHAPLVAALQVGIITITPPDHLPLEEIAVSGGFVRVANDQVIVLADTAETARDIDLERAEMARARAEERLHAAGEEGIDVERARMALLRAINRLRLARGR